MINVAKLMRCIYELAMKDLDRERKMGYGQTCLIIVILLQPANKLYQIFRVWIGGKDVGKIME